MPETPDKKTCFVVMGFGKKPDYQSKPPRTLDLDKSYHHMIKPAVESAGLTCIRADEIQHAGNIDVPMYEQLLSADVVVADLSTSNANALYELGVRHGLRPFTTIMVAEEGFSFPFDVSHTVIRTYKHLGEDIGYGEVVRFQKALKEAIEAVVAKQDTDSPVYTFLPDLQPPSKGAPSASGSTPAADRAPTQPAEDQTTVATLMAQVDDAKKKKDFVTAKTFLNALVQMKKGDDFLVQQLALATYKAGLPSPTEALLEARKILEQLAPDDSADPETLGLWGAIHKRLWEETTERNHLDVAIHGYEKGFFLKNDYYNGINLAFMLNSRAAVAQGDEAIADRVLANRVRRRVIAICEGLVKRAKQEGQALDYWVLATLEEAWYALGDTAKMQEWRTQAEAAAEQTWMRDSTLEQLQKLDKLLGQPQQA